MAGVGENWPHSEPSKEHKAILEQMDVKLQALLQEFKVHYTTQGEIHSAGYQSLWEFADMFIDKATCRTEAAKALKFESGAPNMNSTTAWDTANSNINSIRVSNAMEEAAARSQLQREILRGSKEGPPSAHAVAEAADRAELVKSYVAEFGGPKPPLEHQLADSALGYQFKELSQGRIGYMTVKKMVPLIEDKDFQIKKVQADSSSSESRNYDNFEIAEPEGIETIRRLWQMFSTNFLMCLSGNMHVTKLVVDKQDLVDLYNFLDGPHMARKSPPPSAAIMLAAERAAWKHLHCRVYEGKQLKEELRKLPDHPTLWQCEVYSKERQPAPNDLQPSLSADPTFQWMLQQFKGKGKGYGSWKGSWKPHPAPYDQAPPWKSGKKGKTKGDGYSKGYGSDYKIPLDAEEVDARFQDGRFGKVAKNGKKICFLHQKGTCNNKCDMSHACPRILQSGEICGGGHYGLRCPRQ